jgi:diaminohydroxyphosphoribosylaminopyrimidine deaminase/5-amino-6-(5-phosphoribosylamino)uracil reductase
MKMELTSNYEKYMEYAIELAEKGRGKTSPNPLVGALVVQNGTIVGEGYHAAAGEPHAEINALRQAGDRARGATLVTTLEPCCFQGRTPPCTEAIKEAGIKKVVIGLIDPNPLVSGRGMRTVHESGIEVFSGVMNKRVARQNEIYIKYITTRLPFVLLKVAMSVNGMITSPEAPKITGEESHLEVHRLRDQYDAIMVGIGTVLSDNPLLTSRIPGRTAEHLARIIVDSRGRLPLDARVVSDKSAPTVVATTEKAPLEHINALHEKGVEVLVVASSGGKVDLVNLMEELGKREITSVLLEGGAKLFTAALESGIVDKFVFFIAAKIIGGRKALGVVKLEGLDWWMDLRFSRVKKMGDDLMVEAYPK